MTDKLSYLPLLTRIANNEAAAEGYLSAWAAVTPSSEVRQILSTVALREGEHGKAFAKRVCELGFSLEPTPTKAAERMPIASSRTLTDREKFERLGFGKPVDTSTPDQFVEMFADPTIDIQTGTLLGRYIAEERDSGRMFQGCYNELCAQDGGSNGASMNNGTDRLSRIESMLERLVAKLPG